MGSKRKKEYVSKPIFGYSAPLNLSLIQFILMTAASLILTATQKNYFHFRYDFTMEFATGLNYFSAIVPPFIGLFGAWAADEKFGRHPIIKWSCLLSALGLSIWWSSTFAKFMLWPSILLVGIGSVGAPARLIYGADQLKTEKDISRYWTLIYFLTNIVSLSVIISIGSKIPSWKTIGHDAGIWQVLYGIPPILAIFAAFAMFLPSHKYANHNRPMRSGYVSTIATLFGCGNADPEFTVPLKKLLPLGLIYMIWSISENLGNTAFDSQALTMKKPFNEWPDIGNQMFDGVSSIIATLFGEILITHLRNRGWEMKSQGLIAFALSVSIMAMIYFASLQYFIASTWIKQGTQVHLFVQLPLWLLSRTSEFIMATVLPSYVYTLAHPSQKSLTYTTIIDIANALSSVIAAVMFLIFDKFLQANLSSNGMPLNYNAAWQSLVIVILSLANICLFHVFIGTGESETENEELYEGLLEVYEDSECGDRLRDPFLVLQEDQSDSESGEAVKL